MGSVELRAAEETSVQASNKSTFRLVMAIYYVSLLSRRIDSFDKAWLN